MFPDNDLGEGVESAVPVEGVSNLITPFPIVHVASVDHVLISPHRFDAISYARSGIVIGVIIGQTRYVQTREQQIRIVGSQTCLWIEQTGGAEPTVDSC